MQDPLHDAGKLAALVEGRLEGAERQRVIAHAADCLECRRTLAALGSAIADGTLSQAARPAAAARARWTRPQVWLPIAASVLIASFAWFQYASIQPSATGEDLLVKRSAGRAVAGKTFRMTGGEWIDTSFDPSTALPTVIVPGGEERSAVLRRRPELAPYAELGSRVTVVWQGTVYRFEP